MSTIKTYSELIKLPTFKERYHYLLLSRRIGEETFGYDRYLNQKFYKSREWKHAKNSIIVRDEGLDMGLEGYTIFGSVHIHHMNPITAEDIIHGSDFLFNPEYLICVSFATHNMIHYGDSCYPDRFEPVERKPNDTIPWRV